MENCNNCHQHKCFYHGKEQEETCTFYNGKECIIKQAEDWLKRVFSHNTNDVQAEFIINDLLELIKAKEAERLEDHRRAEEIISYRESTITITRKAVDEQLKHRAVLEKQISELKNSLEFAFKRSMVLADIFGVPVHESPEATGTILGLIRRHTEQLRDQVNRYKQALITIQANYPANATLPWVVTAREALGIHQEEQC